MRYVLVFVMMFAVECFAQEVEHNYEMGPQITTCDSLNVSELSEQDQVREIEHAQFRSVENFSLNRKEGFQAAWFYSCDNKTGMLVAKVNGKKNYYGTIERSAWQEFISSGDFENFLEKISADKKN